mmetsp:Transcript_8151/g.12169  ORF Transcript_8151/g.12169 Transcript_8151/m.12169 type:complete len:747 (-) Transcript_8151:392-2632(-)
MPAHLMDCCRMSIKSIESVTGKTFGVTPDSTKESMPLLLSIRASAAVDMPSMMDSVLNLGINEEVVRKIITVTGNPRFAFDVQRRFLQQYGTVVLKVPKSHYSDIVYEAKAHDGVAFDCDLSYEALKNIVDEFLKITDVPHDPMEQFRRAVEAIFCSWYSPRAMKYRDVNSIGENLGTAIVVQNMVFGNINAQSCTGRVFSRDPNTGANCIYGEFVCQAEGDNVSEGLDQQPKMIEEMESYLPEVYREILRISQVIEQFFGDAQEIEFTVQSGVLFILETVNARRSPEANVKIAVDMVQNLQLTEREALMRVDPKMMSYFTHPQIDPQLITSEDLVLGHGIPTTSGAVSGLAVFNEDDVVRLSREGKSTILIRNESSADDILAINVSNGVLTMHGGVTSVAHELARSMGKTAISAASNCGMELDLEGECVYDSEGEVCIRKEQEITLDGSTGKILNGCSATVPIGAKLAFKSLTNWADQYRRMSLYATVDSAAEAFKAIELRPDGIGLFQTETIFQDTKCHDLANLYFLSSSKSMKEDSLYKLERIHRQKLMEVFQLFPNRVVSVRLLDSSINCFLGIFGERNAPKDSSSAKLHELEEINPAIGVRGCRRAIMNPDFLAMQIRAMIKAAIDVKTELKPVNLEILVPMLTSEHELDSIIKNINATVYEVFDAEGATVEYRIGAVIETPRACLCANKIARTEGLSFVVFGLDRLTELTCGLSRADTEAMISTRELFTRTPSAPWTRMV